MKKLEFFVFLLLGIGVMNVAVGSNCTLNALGNILSCKCVNNLICPPGVTALTIDPNLCGDGGVISYAPFGQKLICGPDYEAGSIEVLTHSQGHPVIKF